MALDQEILTAVQKEIRHFLRRSGERDRYTKRQAAYRLNISIDLINGLIENGDLAISDNLITRKSLEDYVDRRSFFKKKKTKKEKPIKDYDRIFDKYFSKNSSSLIKM